MLKYIKNLFKRDEDPNLTQLRKKFKGSFKGFNDAEQAVLFLRLSGLPKDRIATHLNLSAEQLEKLEAKLLEKL